MTSETKPLGEPETSWYSRLQRQAWRSFIFGAIGYIVVIGVIVATLWSLLQSVESARSQLDDVSGRLDQARKELASTQNEFVELKKQFDQVAADKKAADKELSESREEVQRLRQQLSQIYDFKPYVIEINELDEKMVYGYVGERGFKILRQAIEDERRHLPFSGANSPNAGFTSPGYASYLLSKINVNAPLAQLPRQTGAPQNGDIIVYGAGYTMFYFKLGGKEFVMGMTPEGVLALRPDFSKPVEIRKAYQP